MSDSVAILGRQPALGLAELESLYGATNVRPVGNIAARLCVAPCSIDFNRLGGTIRLCRMLAELETTDWKAVEKFLIQVSPEHVMHMPEGKMHLGLSVYGMGVAPQQLLATGLTLKKVIQSRAKRSVRLVPNKTSELNAAQVLHNKLTGPNGWELVFVRDGNKTLLAQTLHVQDIDSYSERDFGRPKRDARVGMLPPKLAQTIINLAVGPLEYEAVKSRLSGDVCMQQDDEAKMRAERTNATILDPFCGTGVVLQEALLMGYRAYGTDKEPRMVDYTRMNLEWLDERYKPLPDAYTLAVGDATSAAWQPPIDIIASEAYLGRPFTSAPNAEILAQTVADCNLILKKFLKNVRDQLKPGARLCLAIPAWQVRRAEFKHLPLVDQLTGMGYNQMRFEHVRPDDLLYYRPDQIVARELLVITRK